MQLKTPRITVRQQSIAGQLQQERLRGKKRVWLHADDRGFSTLL